MTLNYGLVGGVDHGESIIGPHALETSLSDPNVFGNDVVLTRELTTRRRGDQLIDSSVLDEPETDHAIPQHAGVVSVFRRTWRLPP
jgi:hypothetical protein